MPDGDAFHQCRVRRNVLDLSRNSEVNLKTEIGKFEFFGLKKRKKVLFVALLHLLFDLFVKLFHMFIIFSVKYVSFSSLFAFHFLFRLYPSFGCLTVSWSYRTLLHCSD